MEQDGDNENIFASWMEDDDDDDNNVLVGSVKEGRVLKSLDDALLTATLTDTALPAEEERKSASSPPDFYNMSDDNARCWFDAQDSNSMDGSEESFAISMLEQDFQSSKMDSCGESFGISILEQDFPSPREEPEHKKTTTFANIIATTIEAQYGFWVPQSSLQTLDIFRDESSNKPPSSTSMLGDSNSDMGDDDDDSNFGAIDEDEDDKKIRRQVLYAFGGVGLFTLITFAGKKLVNLFCGMIKDTQDADGGMDMTNVAEQAASVSRDGGSTHTSTATAATQNNIAFQASASASQSQSSMTGGFGMNPVGGAGQAASGNTMSAAHTQVMQIMAVNAASNAASSAATVASGFASVAAVAAGTAAATTVATALSITVAVVCRSIYY
jgi:hypothetical protein